MQFSRQVISRVGLLFICLAIISACDNSPIEHLAISPDYQRVSGDYIPETEVKLRQATISNVQYELNLDLTQMTRYAGTIDIRFNYRPTNYPLTIDFSGGEVERVWLNNAIIGIDYNGEFLTIPAKHLNPGNNRLKVQFSRPFSLANFGLNRFYDPQDQQVYLYTKSAYQDNHHLYPIFDQPELPFDIKAIFTTDKDWKFFSSLTTDKVDERGDYKLWYMSATQQQNQNIMLLAGNWHEWQGKSANNEVKILVRKTIKDLIPIRHWYQRIQRYSETIEPYFGTGAKKQQLTIAVLPGVFQHQQSVAGYLTFSEHPILLQSDLNPAWQQLLVEHNVAINLQQKSSKDQWLKYWLNHYVTQQLFPSIEANKSYAPLFHKRLQPGQQLLSNQYQESLDILNNYSLLAIKAPLLLDGLIHITDSKSLSSEIQSFITQPEKTFSVLLDELDIDSSLSSHSWASQWLGSPGVNQITSQRQCVDDLVSEYRITQQSIPAFPANRQINLILQFWNNDSVESIRATLTSDSITINDFSNVPCDTAIFLSAEPAIVIQTDTKASQFRQLAQKATDISLLKITQQASSTASFNTSEELTQWLHLVRARLEVSSIKESNDLVELLLTNISQLDVISEQLKQSQIRLSNRLLQLSLNTSSTPDERINWFKLHLRTLVETSQADYIFNWITGKSEPIDLSKIDSLRISALERMIDMDYQHVNLLINYYEEGVQTFYVPFLSAMQLIHDTDYTAQEYLQLLLTEDNRTPIQYAYLLLHPQFIPMPEAAQAIAFILDNISALEQRIGASFLQRWLEPILLQSCDYNKSIAMIKTAIEKQQLRKMTNSWLSEIASSCEVARLYNL